jgi:chaperonin GroES
LPASDAAYPGKHRNTNHGNDALFRFYFRRRERVMAIATKTKLKVFPLADRVAIRPMEDTEEMKGGLYIPDTAKEKPIQGEVIAVGPGRMEKGQRVPMELKVGDRVVYGKYTGSQVELDDEEIILIKESDVIAKLS